MTPRVVVPAVWLHALTHPMCELRCASCARSRSLHVHAPGVRARPPGMWCVQQARPRQNLLLVRPRRHVSGMDVRVSAGPCTTQRRGRCRVFGQRGRHRCATSSSPLPLQSTSPPQLATCAPTASRGLAQLDADDVVELLDNEADTVSFHTRLLRHFVEFHGRTYHCRPDAVDLAIGACDLCSDCVRVGRPTLGHALDRHQERRPPVRLVQTYHLLGSSRLAECGVEQTRPRAGNAAGPAAAIVCRAPPAFFLKSTAACSE